MKIIMRKLILCILAMLLGASPFAVAQTVKNYSFEGMLGEKIPVRLTFDVNSHGIAAGEIYYPNSKSPAPILIVGEKSEQLNMFFFREFQNDGVVTGYFNIELSGSNKGNLTLTGEWTNPKTSKSYKFRNMRAVPVPNSYVTPLQPESPDHIGTYYSYQCWSDRDDDMMGGNVTFSGAGKNKINFDVVNCPHNMAIGENEPGRPAVLNGNHFTYYNVNECGYGFEAFFYKRFVVLKDLTFGDTLFCFGMGTSFDGVYIKLTQ